MIYSTPLLFVNVEYESGKYQQRTSMILLKNYIKEKRLTGKCSLLYSYQSKMPGNSGKAHQIKFRYLENHPLEQGFQKMIGFSRLNVYIGLAAVSISKYIDYQYQSKMPGNSGKAHQIKFRFLVNHPLEQGLQKMQGF